MARLQILQLPEGATDERPPFALVVDQANAAEADRYRTSLAAATDEIGARAVLVFADIISIPANDIPIYPYAAPEPPVEEIYGQTPLEKLTPVAAAVRTYIGTLPPGDRARTAAIWKAVSIAFDAHNETLRDALRLNSEEGADIAAAAGAIRRERDEARTWARHGYEIGQRNCGWSDHGVAPEWLTEGWPSSFDACEHATRAAEYDTALTRVRGLSEKPEIMDAQHPDSAGYLHGYGVAIRAAKRAACTGQAQATEATA
jgi:hypothetical protein